MRVRACRNGAGPPCERRNWSPGCGSLWGHEALYWVGETHANTATEAFGGTPYWATKRCTGRGRRMRTPPLRPSVELPLGQRSAVLVGGDACEHRH
eukprot:4667137-Pyramimonas_sp.AAC.1